jgi:hypothetical protein
VLLFTLLKPSGASKYQLHVETMPYNDFEQAAQAFLATQPGHPSRSIVFKPDPGSLVDLAVVGCVVRARSGQYFLPQISLLTDNPHAMNYDAPQYIALREMAKCCGKDAQFIGVNVQHPGDDQPPQELTFALRLGVGPFPVGYHKISDDISVEEARQFLVDPAMIELEDRLEQDAISASFAASIARAGG